MKNISVRIILIISLNLLMTFISTGPAGPYKGHTGMLFAGTADSYHVCTKAGLRMRETADQKGKQIALIPDGAKITFLEEQGDDITISDRKGKWSKVEWNGKTGWVFGGFLCMDISPEEAEVVEQHVLDIKELTGKTIINGEPASGEYTTIEIKKNRTIELYNSTTIDGTCKITGKYEVTGNDGMVTLKVTGVKMTVSRYDKVTKSSPDDFTLEIEKDKPNYLVTGKVPDIGKLDKTPFIAGN
jgi:hypothetical protein